MFAGPAPPYYRNDDAALPERLALDFNPALMSPDPALSTTGLSGTSLADRYRVLLDVGRTLTGTLSLEDLYRAIYRETKRVLPADGFYISLYDAGVDEATIVFFADRGREQRVDVAYRGSESAVIRTGRPVRVDDMLSAQSLMLLGENGGEVMRAALAAPLRAKGEVIGAISTQSYQPKAFTEADSELFHAIADMAAVAMANARHVEALERGAAEARQIEEIGRAMAASLDTDDVMSRVIDAAISLLPADGAAVWMMHDGPRARVHVARGEVELPEGLEWDTTGEIYDALVREGRALGVSSLEESPLLPENIRAVLTAGAGLACPLKVSSSVVGVLTAGSRTPKAFAKEDLGVLERLASQASVALENARLHQSLQSLSLTDPLTGLANRRHLSVHLELEMAAARRGRGLLAILFDLDNFKRFNDSRGHVAGDDALKAFARILTSENRAMNLVARYGGDEFISILSDAGSDGAEQYATRIRRRMAQDPVLGPAGISVSYGLAEFTPEMDTGEELIHAADADLYRHKENRDSSR